MNRRQLAFIIIFNAMISLVIALLVVWAVEARRPDAEELAILSPPSNSQPVDQPLPTAATAPQLIPTAATAPADPNGDPAPAATPTAAATPSGEQEVYIVAAGDSLSSIADRFGVPVNTIVEFNQLADPNFVFSGQRLLIPVDGASPVVATSAASPAPTQAAQGIAIRAVEAPGDLLNEAVQIVNDGDGAVNLNGWQLVSASGASYTFGDLALFPGNYVWVHSGSGQDTSIARYWGQEAAVWTSGIEVQLRNSTGEVLTRYSVP